MTQERTLRYVAASPDATSGRSRPAFVFLFLLCALGGFSFAQTPSAADCGWTWEKIEWPAGWPLPLETFRGLISAVWTGKEMIVHGGHDRCYYAVCGGCIGQCPHGDGYAYDPRTKTWRALSTGNNEWKSVTFQDYLPTSRGSHTAVWSPATKEMLVFGGQGGPTPDFWFCYLSHGEAYDVSKDSWRSTSRTDEPKFRSDHSAVWAPSTKEMLVWGGESTSAPCTNDFFDVNSGGAYHPGTDTWRPMTPAAAPFRRQSHSGIWSEATEEKIVWGGICISRTCGTWNDGGRYHPATDTWTPVTTVNAPRDRAFHAAVWADTTQEMIIWGGASYVAPFNLDCLNDGMHYDPGADVWRESFNATIAGRRYPCSVWTGKEILIYGGGIDNADTCSTATNDGFFYNPETKLLLPVESYRLRGCGGGSQALWTGLEMIIWGITRDDDGNILWWAGESYRAPGWYYADFTGDGRVDGEDLAFLARAFGCAKGEACYQKKADIYGRDWDGGFVDATDLFLFTEVFGQRKPAGCMQ